MFFCLPCIKEEPTPTQLCGAPRERDEGSSPATSHQTKTKCAEWSDGAHLFCVHYPKRTHTCPTTCIRDLEKLTYLLLPPRMLLEQAKRCQPLRSDPGQLAERRRCQPGFAVLPMASKILPRGIGRVGILVLGRFVVVQACAAVALAWKRLGICSHAQNSTSLCL